MKTIAKSPEHDCLGKAKDKGWSWDEFVDKDHDNYVTVRNQALTDQKQECAYTGLWLGSGTNHILHIDHFRKKSIYPELRFDWNNLFAAAKNLKCGSDYKDKNIHGSRDNAESQYSSFLSPLEANLESMFWYQQNGKVNAHPRLSESMATKVENTIKMYNLNDDDLVSRRRSIIQILRNLDQMDDDTIRECMITQGFSFLVEFELSQRVDE